MTGEGASAKIKILYTVEAMPMDLGLEFVAIDEIQLCLDHERGHIFTDGFCMPEKKQCFLGRKLYQVA